MTAWDLADLDRLAAACATIGKRPAIRVYHDHAAKAGWHGTPAWITGREAFMRFYRGHRAKVAA